MAISSIGSSHRYMPERTERTKPEAGDAAGKSANSVGHQAKAAIAAAENPDLPSNIQGQVASALARGIDFTPLLAINRTDTETAITDGTVTDVPVEDDATASGDSVAAEEEADMAAASGTTTPPADATDSTDDAQIGLDLLIQASSTEEES